MSELLESRQSSWVKDASKAFAAIGVHSSRTFRPLLSCRTVNIVQSGWDCSAILRGQSAAGEGGKGEDGYTALSTREGVRMFVRAGLSSGVLSAVARFISPETDAPVRVAVSTPEIAALLSSDSPSRQLLGRIQVRHTPESLRSKPYVWELTARELDLVRIVLREESNRFPVAPDLLRTLWRTRAEQSGAAPSSEEALDLDSGLLPWQSYGRQELALPAFVRIPINEFERAVVHGLLGSVRDREQG